MRIRLIDCGKCEICCHGTPGHGIAARLANGNIPKIIKSGRCEYLGRNNSCNKGQNRPIECAWYPLKFFQDGIYIDKSCPGWESALEQFKDFMSFMPEEIKKQGKPELIMGWMNSVEERPIQKPFSFESAYQEDQERYK